MERTELEKVNQANTSLKSDMDWIKIEMQKMKKKIEITSKLKKKR